MKKIAAILIGGSSDQRSSFCGDYFKQYEHIKLDTLRARFKEDRALADCILRGCSFVVDQPNASRLARKKYIDLGISQGYSVVGYCFEQRNDNIQLPKYDEGFDLLCFVRCGDDGFIVEELE